MYRLTPYLNTTIALVQSFHLAYWYGMFLSWTNSRKTSFLNIGKILPYVKQKQKYWPELQNKFTDSIKFYFILYSNYQVSRCNFHLLWLICKKSHHVKIKNHTLHEFLCVLYPKYYLNIFYFNLTWFRLRNFIISRKLFLKRMICS